MFGHSISLSQISNLIQMAVMLISIIALAVNQHRRKLNIQFVLVMCALGCYFASDLYWSAFLAIRADFELPKLSPVELGELGMCLFFIAALNVESYVEKRMKFWKTAVICLFCLVNGAFWSIWSGSILNSAVSLCGLLPLCLVSIKSLDDLEPGNKKMWTGFGLGFGLVTIADIITYFTTGTVYAVAEITSYVLWMLGWVNLLVVWFKEIRKVPKTEPVNAVTFRITVNMFCMGFFALYACTGAFYIICDSLMTVASGLMVYSLIRRGYRYDLL